MSLEYLVCHWCGDYHGFTTCKKGWEEPTMNDELTTYRICYECEGTGGPWHEMCDVCLATDGPLGSNPDTRLQAIADAPRCKHGNIYPHIDGDSVTSDPGIARWYICQGSPEKAALLDALLDALGGTGVGRNR